MKRSGESTRSASDAGDVLRLLGLRVQEHEQGDARDAVDERERRHPADRVHDIGPAELPAAPQRRANAEPLVRRAAGTAEPEEPEERERRQHVQTQQDRERAGTRPDRRDTRSRDTRRGGRSAAVSAHA